MAPRPAPARALDPAGRRRQYPIGHAGRVDEGARVGATGRIHGDQLVEMRDAEVGAASIGHGDVVELELRPPDLLPGTHADVAVRRIAAARDRNFRAVVEPFDRAEVDDVAADPHLELPQSDGVPPGVGCCYGMVCEENVRLQAWESPRDLGGILECRAHRRPRCRAAFLHRALRAGL